MKYLFKISQDETSDWDTYDSAVVCAESEDEAKKIHPRMIISSTPSEHDWKSYAWASSPDRVKAVRIGVADESIEVGTVICASFNAG